MDEFTKEQLVAQFRSYLDDVPVPPVTSPAPDLFSLFTELAGLRNEVKLESRQVKSALDQFRSVFELLQTSQASLGQERAQHQAVQQQQHQGEIRSLLLEFIDLYDRLEAGSRASIYVPPTGFRFCRCLEHVNLIQSIHEGQAITLRRLIDMLARHQVYPLTVVNQVFDPIV
ncbi:MAG: nucleotide exchange factor GrpE [Thiotrichaceae bacterium]